MAFDKRRSLQNALNYTQQGKWDRAIAEYQSILKADPKDLTVCNNLGDLYARGGKTAEAIEQYQKLGELYRTDGLSVKAIAVYKKIVKLDPSLTSAYQACADLYWEQGLVGEAKIQMATVVEHYAKTGDRPKLIEAYRRLTQFDPTNSAAIARLADLLLKEGRQEDAAAEYDRAAQAAQAAGQTAEAGRFIQKARELLPRTTEETLGLAETLREEGRLAEAEELLAKTAAAKPENAKAWQALGEMQASLGKSAEAVVSLQQAASLGLPESAVAPALGQALLQAGRFDEAIALCQRLSDKALATGDPDQAVVYCRGLLALSPRLIPLHAHLSAMLQNLGRNDEAGAALRAMAAAQEAAGETDAAIESYRRLLDLDPTDVEAQAQLETLIPNEAPTLEVVDLTPASTSEETATLLEEPTLLLEDLGAEGQVEINTLGLSGLEDLTLSFDKDEVALLLEEPGEASQEAAGGPSISVDEGGFGLEIGPETETTEGIIESETVSGPETLAKPETQTAPEAEKETESVSESGWLSQGFEPLELEGQTPDGGVSPVDWPASETPVVPHEAPLGVGLPTEDGAPSSLDLTPPSDEFVAAEFGAPLTAEGFPEEALPVPVEASELPQGIEADALDLQALTSRQEEDSAAQVAEQLAEAEVYQKYGLEGKARERLLEVLRLAPENLTAHRGLKAIYVERQQIDEASAETLAIARILRGRGNETAAIEEIQEGLALAPDNHELQRSLAEVREAHESAADTGSAEAASLAEPPILIEPASSPGEVAALQEEPLVSLEPGLAGANDAPPPDVPLLLEFEEPSNAGLTTSANFDHVFGPSQDEELPSELRALLDQIEERPTLEVEAVEPNLDQSVEDDVAEADFYLSQGMQEEARTVLRRMQDRNPDHPAVASLTERMAAATEALQPPAAVAEVSPSDRAEQPAPAEAPDPPAIVPLPSGETWPDVQETVPKIAVTESPAESPEADIVNRGVEPQEAVAEEVGLAMAAEGGPVVDNLLQELQKGVPEQLDEKDYETHYNLGIAYKEMELFDEAIQEFRLTMREPKRALDSADLIGLCFLAKGQPEQAIEELQAGLEREGHPPEAYHSLRHDLGTAYEASGSLGRALDPFEILQSEGARFPDVQARMQMLRGRLSQPPEPSKADGKPSRKKKKITFI